MKPKQKIKMTGSAYVFIGVDPFRKKREYSKEQKAALAARLKQGRKAPG